MAGRGNEAGAERAARRRLRAAAGGRGLGRGAAAARALIDQPDDIGDLLLITRGDRGVLRDPPAGAVRPVAVGRGGSAAALHAAGESPPTSSSATAGPAGRPLRAAPGAARAARLPAAQAVAAGAPHGARDDRPAGGGGRGRRDRVRPADRRVQPRAGRGAAASRASGAGGRAGASASRAAPAHGDDRRGRRDPRRRGGDHARRAARGVDSGELPTRALRTDCRPVGHDAPSACC